MTLFFTQTTLFLFRIMNRTVISIIKKLKLKKHPEGGYYSETYRSKGDFKKSHLPKKFGGRRSHSTTIYFLLEGKQFSAFHRLKTDEVWHFYSGSPLNICVIKKNGKLEKIILGKNHCYQTVIRAEQWFAAEVTDQKSYSLVGCTVSPGFDYRDFQLAEEKKLVKLYPHLKGLISRLTIK